MHQWVNTFIALFAVFISFIGNREHLSRWWGIRSLSGVIVFHEDDPFHRKPGFTLFVQNKGSTPKDIAFIQTDKRESIYWFYDYEDESGVTLPAGKKLSIFLDIEFHLKKLEQADSLILINGIGDEKEIIEKKDIQRVLELYKSSQ